MTKPELLARVTVLEDAVLAAWEIITGTVPAEPRGLEEHYVEELADTVEDIQTKRGIPA